MERKVSNDRPSIDEDYEHLAREDRAASDHQVAKESLLAPGETTRQDYLLEVRGVRIGRPWMVLVGSILVMLGLGAQHTWGALSPYVSSPGFIFDADNTQTIWGFTMCGATMPVSMLLAARLQRRFGFAPTAVVGAVIAAGALALTSLATHLAILILTFGVMLGFGIGLAYSSAVVGAQRWYPKKRGLIGGIVLAAYGIGSFCYNLVAKVLCNPNGLATRSPTGATESEEDAWAAEFHEEMSRTIPRTFLVMSAMLLGLAGLGSLLLHVPKVVSKPITPPASTPEPAESKDEEVTVEMTEKGEDASAQNSRPPENLDTKHMLCTVQFWMLYFVITSGITACALVLGSFGEFAKKEGQFDPPFALIGGLAALSNAVGRIIWGMLADLLDYRRTYVIDLTLLSVMMFLYYETRTNVVAWAAVTCVIYACYGGFMALMPTTVADAFGPQFQSTNYAIMTTALSVGNISQALLLSLLLKAFGSFRGLFYMVGIAVVLADVVMIAYKPPNRGRWFAIWLSYKRKN